MRLWNAKRGGKASPEKRPGVTINRCDLISIPVPVANLLWRSLHVREGDTSEGKTRTANIRIDITVEGVTNDISWSCGLEFDYSNEESFVCRPSAHARYENVPVKDAKFSAVPAEAAAVKFLTCPPCPAWPPKSLSGNRAESMFCSAKVRRPRFCIIMYQIYEKPEARAGWQELVDRISNLFGVTLCPPQYIIERGEIRWSTSRMGLVLTYPAPGVDFSNRFCYWPTCTLTQKQRSSWMNPTPTSKSSGKRYQYRSRTRRNCNLRSLG